MNDEQTRYLTEGNRHRARFYGTAPCELRDADLTLALAWWCAWWKDRADRAEESALRGADHDTMGLFG